MVKKRKSRFNRRTKTRGGKIKLFTIGFVIFSIIGLIVWGVLRVMESSFLKAEIKWEIDRKLPIARTVLQESIRSLTENKYQFDTDRIKQILESQPWVAKAHITDNWFSNDIQIKIESQQIAMRWRNIDCKKKKTPNCIGYISNDGELFTPYKTVKSEAPLAHSKEKQEIIVQLYQDYQNYQKQAGKMLIKLFSRTHIDKLIFKSDIKVILGYQQKHKRLKRFLKAYKKLRKKIAKAKLQCSTFDMRYPKGFSMKYH
jgi:cell division protein FtsQ